MSLETVVIIIPTYNEAACIENTIHEVFCALNNIQDYQIQILIFDSHSTDDTPFIVQNLQHEYDNLLIKSEPEKSGLGSAYRQAMQYALDELNADIVIEFDADLSHQPQYLKPMLEAIKHHDVVVGSRYVNHGSTPDDWGLHRKALSKIGNWVTRICLTRKYKDFTSGFRATKRHALSKSLPPRFLSNGYAYKVELMWRLHKNQFQITETPIHFKDRKQGHSKLPANSIFDTLSVILKLRLNPWKTYFRMCLVGFIGLALQLLVYNIARQSISPFYASVIAVSFAILNNYILNNRFTFKSPRFWTKRHKIRSFGLFLGYSFLMVFGQSYWLYALMQLIGHGVYRENMAVLSGIILGSLLNYLVYSRIIWQQHKVS